MATPKVIISNQYSYDTQEKPGVDFPADDPNSRSVTNQSDKDSADINLIMARYEKTGMINVNGENRQPMYGDFASLPDFLETQNRIIFVKKAFEALPASTRTRFNNNPQEIIDFLADPQNDAEAVKLGLKDKSVLPVPDVWDAKNGKWTSGKTGEVLENQPPPPAAPAAPAQGA